MSVRMLSCEHRDHIHTYAHACEGQSVVCSPASLFDFIFAITLTTLLRYDTGVTISIYSYSAWRTARASLSLACVVQYLVKWRLEISSQASQHEKKSQISLVLCLGLSTRPQGSPRCMLESCRIMIGTIRVSVCILRNPSLKTASPSSEEIRVR